MTPAELSAEEQEVAELERSDRFWSGFLLGVTVAIGLDLLLEVAMFLAGWGRRC